MKRSGMNLRSTTSIQPKLTDVQLGGFMADDTSPLKQIQVSNNEEGGVDAIEEATLGFEVCKEFILNQERDNLNEIIFCQRIKSK